MNAATVRDEQVGTTALENLDFEPEIPCEANGHNHAAAFIGIPPCGHSVAMCERYTAFARAWLDAGNRFDCSECSKFFDSARFEPIK